MVRIACLISGVPRSFSTNAWPFFQDMLKCLPEEHTLDFFFSFPKESSVDRFLNIDESFHETLQNHPNVRVLYYEDYAVKDDSYTLREKNSIVQWYRLERLITTLPKDVYSIVIRCRPDIQFSCSPSEFLELLLTHQNHNAIYIPKGFDIYDHKITIALTQPTVNDQLAWGSFDCMLHYCSVFQWIQEHTPHRVLELAAGRVPHPFISEAILYSILHEKGITIERVDCPYHLRISQCFSFAICGESGAGKSTLSKYIQEILPYDQTLLLETDRYHKWERGAKEYQTYTHYNPEANHLEKLAQDAYSLHLGDDIFTVDYDHETGKFTDVQQISSANFVILCGLHTLYKDSIRNCLDLKIYLDTDETLVENWKIERDMRERGASRETILRAIEKRREDFLLYIAPQKTFADIVVQFKQGFSDQLNLRIIIQNLSLYLNAQSALQSFTLESKEGLFPCFTCVDSPDHERMIRAAKELGYTNTNPLAQGFNGLLQLLCIAIVWKPLMTT